MRVEEEQEEPVELAIDEKLEAKYRELINDINAGNTVIIDNPMKAYMKRRESEAAKLNFDDVKNFDELYNKIRAAGSIEMRGKMHSAEQVINIIEKVVEQKDEENFSRVTRNHNLRSAVIRLIENN